MNGGGLIMKRAARGIACAALAVLWPCGFAASAAPAKSVAFLGVQFLNDHAADEPTSAAEGARVAALAAQFKDRLEASGRYAFAPTPAKVADGIANGPVIGSCGGCEFEYGAELHGELVAWVVVQKVSNLILNLNVYLGDVTARRLTFVHSVDIRGNTDESWTRGMNYLVKNYLLPAAP